MRDFFYNRLRKLPENKGRPLNGGKLRRKRCRRMNALAWGKETQIGAGIIGNAHAVALLRHRFLPSSSQSEEVTHFSGSLRSQLNRNRAAGALMMRVHAEVIAALFKVAIRISPFHVDATPCCRDAMSLILPALWPFLFRDEGGGGGVGYLHAHGLAHLVVAAREHHGLVLGRAAHHLLTAAACHAFYEHFHLAAYLGAV